MKEEIRPAAYTSSARRIARNTLMLYFRQILIMLVSLYTVRVVLGTLGAEDYGVYNVVAGVVVMFSFVNNAMASGTQRFLNFYLGRKDLEKAGEVYSASVLIHLFIALIFVAAAETLGLWFVGARLNVPEARRGAAAAAYQMAILTVVFSVLRTPYHATVVAYERMSFFALLSVVEAVLKLAVVFLLRLSSFDRLVFYAFLLAAVSLAVTLVYKIYCNRVFETAHYRNVGDRGFVREQLSFSGWSLFGATANVCCSQGTNIALNLFTDVTVNAAMGIANQVNAAVYSFVGNFQTAFQPQIVKSYAEGDRNFFFGLIFRASKISFLLLTFLAVPLLVNTEFVLDAWLKNPPEHSANFVRLILVWSLVDSWNGPLWISVQATGNIRRYQVIVSALIFANLPLAALALALGAEPEWVLIVRVILACVITLWRVLFLGGRISLPRRRFVSDVLLRSVAVFCAGIFLTLLFGRFFADQTARFFATCASGVFFTAVLTAAVGVNSAERTAALNFVRRKFGRTE